jgi:hypothetical protein
VLNPEDDHREAQQEAAQGPEESVDRHRRVTVALDCRPVKAHFPPRP